MISKPYLEDLVAPYAKAPIYYQNTVDPIFINYMKEQHKKIENSPEFIDAWRLLINGQIRVIYTVLIENNISAIVKRGTLEWSNKENFPPTLVRHFWIDVDPYRIDYRGRNWYEFNIQHKPIIEQVPYGVFIPADFPFVSYQDPEVEQICPLK